MTSPQVAAPVSSETVPPLLRAAVGVVAASSVSVLGVSGLLPFAWALVSLAVLAAAVVAPVRLPPPEGRAPRAVAAAAVISAWALAAFAAKSDAVPGDLSAALVQLGRLLAPLATGVLIGQLLITDRLRDVRAALVLSGMAFLLAVGLHPRPTVALPLVVGWVALVCACHELHVARRRTRADVVAAADDSSTVARPWRQLTAVAAGAAAIAVAVATLLPTPDTPPRNRFGGAGTAPGSGSRSAQAYSSGVLDLRARGALPDTPVLEVPGTSPGLWRGIVLTQYDGTTWQSPRGGWWKDTGVAAPPEVTTRDEVRVREGFPGVLVAPGRPLDVNVEGRVQEVAGGYLLRGPTDAAFPLAYAVTSARPAVDASALRSAAGRDIEQPDVTSVPAGLPDRVKRLADQVTRDAGTRYDAVRSVERFLAARATYRLDSPVPPPGQDAVDHFLFDARTGFCEQFASAETVMLRAVGIPARFVTGYSGGDPVDDGARRLVRAANAHAWVEVWYPGVGWVASDPTAGTRLADTGRPLLERIDEQLNRLTGRTGLGIALVVAAGLVGAGVWWANRRRRRSPARPEGRATSVVLAAFARLEIALERAGRPRQPTESVAELSRRLDPDPDLAAALAVVERSCYDRRQPGFAEANEAARVLDDVAARMLAEQSRPEPVGRLP